MGLPSAANHWLAEHHGVISSRRLQRIGLSEPQVLRLAVTGQLVRVHRGVYRSAQWPQTSEGRCVAACLAVPRGAISHKTAARLWGLRRCSGDDDIELLTASDWTTKTLGVTVHRASDLVGSDVVRRRDGIVLTSPVRTACDLAARLDDEDLASVIEQVLDDYRVRYRTVLRTAQRLMRTGWAGSARLGRVTALRQPGAAAHDSHLEVSFARALVSAGLPAAVAQLPIRTADGIVVHGDLGFPNASLVVEVDHRTWHSGAQAALDKRRDRLVKLAGFDTVRVTDDDLKRRFDATVAEVVAIHDRLTTANTRHAPTPR